MLTRRQETAQALADQLHKLGALVVNPMPLADSARLRFHVKCDASEALCAKLASWGWSPRPVGESVDLLRSVNVYFRHGNLACKRCHKAIPLSQKLGKRTRPILKAHRLERFILLKTNSQQRTRDRLLKRYGEEAMMPVSSYRVRSPPHWK